MDKTFVKDQTYTVDMKVYKATNAYSPIGINAASGHIFFISTKSATYAARELWKTEPSPADLPALRLQSDIAWVSGIHRHGIIEELLFHNNWYLELGLLNGIAAGYFLAQHNQLGCDKMIHIVTVFRVKEDNDLPKMIFWVKDVPSHPWMPTEPPN
ncbi:hypothetical protein EK21DRAFT_118642 [Setomelanomma holmii]|uniref:Uncharacterized protein n=1 Tax=Setomelanomma holmii TaxID=210430 RepID=A0A9P4GY01_9PLEO|nr:hypothetical protein EK21DRAFT_118642 [Setomelanomma holmii]